MQITKVEFENVLIANMKIFYFLARKYLVSFQEYDITDLVHEQVIACYQAFEKYNSESNIGTFLYAVSENHLRNLYRRNNRLKRMPNSLIYTDLEKLEYLSLNDFPFYAEYQAIVCEELSYIESIAPDILSEFEYTIYREVIKGNRKPIDVAAEMGIPKRKVENAVNRLRRKLIEKRKVLN